MIAALCRAELKLLVRNRTAATMAVVMPVLMGVLFAVNIGSQEDGWPMAITLQVLTGLGFTVYITATTALTSRRQDLYLKRLRTGAASDPVVLTGVLLPIVVLGVVQTALLLAVSLVAGAPMPTRPDLLVLALVTGAVLTCAAGVATSGVTATAELAQITTAPFFFALLGGGFWMTIDASDQALLVPGAGIAALVRAAWGDPTPHPALAVAATVAWTVVGTALAVRLFRWERRT